MKISVVIPALNEEQTIGANLRELRERSSFRVGQIIVSDGGSRDATRTEAALAGADVVYSPARGRAAQMNAGAEAAEGEILYFLHADTLPPPGYDRMIEQAAQAGFPAGCFRLGFDSSHPVLRFYAWCTRFDLDAFRFGDQSLFIERKFFNTTGGYRSGLLVMEDNEMVRRIKKERPFKIIPANVTTSARKYRENGVIRLQFIFTLIFILYHLGFSQEKLATLYRRLVPG